MNNNHTDGVPCNHSGCSSHISHPCEQCGRIGANEQLTTRYNEMDYGELLIIGMYHKYTVHNIDWSAAIEYTYYLIDKQIERERNRLTTVIMNIKTFIHGLYPGKEYYALLQEYKQLTGVDYPV